MFKRFTTKFGPYEMVSFRHQSRDFGLEIIPSAGANLKSLTLNGIDVIDGVVSAEELSDNEAYKSTFLAPFPNRIKDGKYEFQGKKYQLEINELPNNNALHGLIYAAPFDLVEEVINEDSVIIKLKNEYIGDLPGYPFAFDTQITITLDIEKGFTGTLIFNNQSGQPIPFGYGWHPYFRLSDKIDLLKLQTPPVKRFKVDKQMIPVGNRENYDEFIKLKSLKGVQLDDCFEISETGDICETLLVNEKGNTIKLWQETGHKKLNYLQIYTPPHGKSIAIEPQTCCIDAFNNKYGLFHLEGVEMLKASFGIILSLD